LKFGFPTKQKNNIFVAKTYISAFGNDMTRSTTPRHSRQKDYSKYAFMNLSLEPMEGEEWKDIPQFDGCYAVSNYGRIWATPRPVISITGQSYYTKERIRKQCLTKYYNAHTKDYTEQLSLHLRYEGKSYSLKVNRLVYEFFVAAPGIDMEDLLVVHNDGDNCNNRYDNLVLMNGTELYGHGLKMKKRPRTGKKNTKSKPPIWSDKNSPRPIVQYSLDGKKLNEYDSIEQAAMANNTNRESIRTVAQQKLIQLYGFVYRFKDTPYHGEHAGFSFEKTVTQYHLNGKKVRTYKSVKEAASNVGVDPNTISKCALGKSLTCGGFVWRYEGNTYNGEYQDKIKNKPKEIVQYNLNGKRVARFESVNEASRVTGCSPAVLLDCAHKKSKVAHGFIWRFANETYKGEYRNYRRGKPVTQHTVEGKRIDTFPTIAAAAIATGLTPDNIQKNVNGHNKTAGGFIWRFATAKEIQKLPPAETEKHPDGVKGKQVVQYSLEGKKLALHSSLTEAAKACGITVSGISSALDHPFRAAAGFVWRTKGNRYRGRLASSPPANKARTVTQYDGKGIRLQVYKSTREAGLITGLSASSISRVARGELKSTGSFIWQYGDGPVKINILEYFADTRQHLEHISKPVLKYSLAGELLKEYPSISEAARQEGIRLSRISAVINGRSKSAGGDYWKLKVE
jgi:hypothetical protein